MFLALLDLVVGELRQIVDHWVLANRSLNLHEGVLGRRELFFSLLFSLFLLALLSSLSSVVIFGDTCISLCSSLVWTQERAQILFSNLSVNLRY